jgi:ribosomal protein L11 methyltransferase
MKWTRVTIRAGWKACDEISGMLIAIGAGGVEIEDPLDKVLMPERTDASEVIPIETEAPGIISAGADTSVIIPEGADMSIIPEGADASIIPEGADASIIPEGADASFIPAGAGADDKPVCITLGEPACVIADNPEYITINAYFPESVYNRELMHIIKEKMENIARQTDAGEWSLDFARVDERDWANEWKKHFRPFHITGSIVIKPSWDHYRAQAGEKVVELDPGMAFGTGKHETTRMCACLIEKYMEAGSRVADIGCGSGILAIIADFLGAANVDAVDIDQNAVTAATENVKKNGAEGRISVKKGGIEKLSGKYDFITANIIADVLIDLAGKLPLYLEKGGMVAASGIIKDREQDVMQAFKSNGFIVGERVAENDWTAVLFLKNHF